MTNGNLGCGSGTTEEVSTRRFSTEEAASGITACQAERATLVRGKLVVWSELGSGTEIEITIPAVVAYAKSAPAHQSVTSGQ